MSKALISALEKAPAVIGSPYSDDPKFLRMYRLAVGTAFRLAAQEDKKNADLFGCTAAVFGVPVSASRIVKLG